jgi:GTP cyclohydrolase I
MDEYSIPKDYMQRAVVTLLENMRLDPCAPGLKETPRRVTAYLLEFCKPFPENIWTGVFDAGGHSGIIALSGIPFRMICEHHLLPALGHAAIGYIPNKSILGLSKLPRLVDAVGTERPSLQEKITDRVVDLLEEHIEPKGSVCVIKAEHTCVACRGVATPGIITTTSSVRGNFRNVPACREEFFAMISGNS